MITRKEFERLVRAYGGATVDATVACDGWEDEALRRANLALEAVLAAWDEHARELAEVRLTDAQRLVRAVFGPPW